MILFLLGYNTALRRRDKKYITQKNTINKKNTYISVILEKRDESHEA